MKKKLLLIFPKSFALSYGDMQFIRDITGKAGLMNASLPTIAALTPPEFEVEIIDENYDSIDYQGAYDLVGITGFHNQIEIIRLIATKFRSKGTIVICGGPSVSVSPERWREFSDVLIIGEAEIIWPEFCRDYLTGKYKDNYKQKIGSVDLSQSPVPDYSPLSMKKIQRYFGGIVQTSRGCPFDCEFCDVIVYLGRKIRYKPVTQILKEVKQVQSLGMKFVMLADDNFSAIRENAKKILRALRDYNKTLRNPLAFGTQLSIDAAKDTELLELASEAGLNRVLVGIESTNPDSLKEVRKAPNINIDLLASIKEFHQHGIMVMGSSIVGFDHDNLSAFKSLLDFYTQAGIISPHPFPLHAPDGTPLKKRLIQEGRYLDWNPTLPPEQVNNFNTFSMVPKQMTVRQLEAGMHWLIRELIRPHNVFKRLANFFDHFESSPKRKKLQIPKSPLDLQSLSVLVRLLRYLILYGSSDERKLFARMIGLATKSSHPQHFAIAITMFLQTKNTILMLKQLNPNVESVHYPTTSYVAAQQ
ncbi:MAG: B12-binding domain-containing radical SAM protein [Planctomycetota bacterium]